MQYEELLHWSDGQFLQPHHFQYLQRQVSEYIRQNRELSLPYPYGLMEFGLDREALSGSRVVVKRFSAIMAGGQELSMPGNCVLTPLDLAPVLEQNPNELTISIALPRWSEFDANLVEDDNLAEKRRYLSQKKRLRDENSGDNEITLVTRRLNLRLVTNLDDTKDMELLPIAKLSVLSHDRSINALALNEKYIPPFLQITQDNPLMGIITGLLVDVRRCRDKALDDLSTARALSEAESPGEAGSVDAYNLQRFRILNIYEIRLSALIESGRISPSAYYLELLTFLGELMGLDPFNSIDEIPRYNHEDYGPQFSTVIKDIRSFILAGGSVDYKRLDFSPIEDGQYLFTRIRLEDLLGMEKVYLAVKTGAESAEVISALETGDTFKLINPASKTMRVRGIKLSAERYPPRYLPVLKDTLWFLLDLKESATVWREVREEQGMVIDYAPNLFPALEGSLYITLESR
ncbi:MAG: type VI secretion system baseplate subunit TssK [Spirochaetaceae bacterium]|jgi:type VI secretion system ImpJ/VasE family protein|nr:type VI secretion system baseplate subunit TssK [Spirochaetaceae bacterium]